MKKTIIRLIACLLFTASYSGLLSLAMGCFMHLPSISLVSAWTGELYPRLTLFCYATPIVATIALVCLLIFNIKISDILGYTKDTWLGQTVCAFVISIPMIQLWINLIALLREVF